SICPVRMERPARVHLIAGYAETEPGRRAARGSEPAEWKNSAAADTCMRGSSRSLSRRSRLEIDRWASRGRSPAPGSGCAIHSTASSGAPDVSLLVRRSTAASGVTMSKDLTFVGLDVHAETIAVAVVAGRDAVRSLGVVPNTPDAIRRIMGRLGPRKNLRVCYEAGPTGYVLYWQLTGMGIQCDVVAPSLVPTKAGDRIKTDRRDAERLARAHRSGDLTAIWVPDSAHEALRDLVRAREAAKEDQLRAKHRLTKYLLRYGQRPMKGTRAWTAIWWQWVRAVNLPEDNQNVVLMDLIMEVDLQAQRIA